MAEHASGDVSGVVGRLGRRLGCFRACREACFSVTRLRALRAVHSASREVGHLKSMYDTYKKDVAATTKQMEETNARMKDMAASAVARLIQGCQCCLYGRTVSGVSRTS